MPALSPEYLSSLLVELCKQPAETGVVEFKENNSSPDDIGEYISALSNTAALNGKAEAYVVWGVRDKTHEIVGTTFQPALAKKGNENLENWLTRLLEPQVHIQFHEFVHEGKNIVILQIPRASHQPVSFSGAEYIRIGSYRKKLKEHAGIEKKLWRVFDTTPFEEQIALPHAAAATVLSLLDYPRYFELLRQPLPADDSKIIPCFIDDRLIVPDATGHYDITNLGAILFARNLGDFRSLSRKALRIIAYQGNSRLKTIREQVVSKGYASGFAGMIDDISAMLPHTETIGVAFRSEIPAYPDEAIRELTANALIHQDFSITGAGPMIEIFASRVEVTNPGPPLVSPDRFLDKPPCSRNEAIASFMRRVRICEERGSGVDKIVAAVESRQLPAPVFEVHEHFTRAFLFARKELKDMTRSERVHACYLHACLRYIELDPMTNSSLRARFGILEHNSAIASRITREAMEDGLIKSYDPDQGRKYAKYIPNWA